MNVWPCSTRGRHQVTVSPVRLSPGLPVTAVPGSLMSPPRMALQVAPPAGHSVLLVSNLDPEVRGHTVTQQLTNGSAALWRMCVCVHREFPPTASSSCLVRPAAVIPPAPSRGSLTCDLCVSGVYGDVQRVKILFNKKENALVQMSDATQAQLGQNQL